MEIYFLFNKREGTALPCIPSERSLHLLVNNGDWTSMPIRSNQKTFASNFYIQERLEILSITPISTVQIQLDSEDHSCGLLINSQSFYRLQSEYRVDISSKSIDYYRETIKVMPNTSSAAIAPTTSLQTSTSIPTHTLQPTSKNNNSAAIGGFAGTFGGLTGIGLVLLAAVLLSRKYCRKSTQVLNPDPYANNHVTTLQLLAEKGQATQIRHTNLEQRDSLEQSENPQVNFSPYEVIAEVTDTLDPERSIYDEVNFSEASNI